MNAGPPPADPFYLPTKGGQRLCLYHAPAAPAARGHVLHVHAFAEEMNKCRRIASLQARALAGAGYGVLQIDLYGCGDSSGDFADARWDIWKADLDAARRWLQRQQACPLHLWGDRLGALLALDYLRERPGAAERLVLWQPVLAGATYLNQFLRLKLAGDMLAAPSDHADQANNGGHGSKSGTAGLRALWLADGSMEIAGYEISADLAKAIDALDAREWTIPVRQLHWLELLNPGQHLAPARQRIADAWKQLGNPLQLHPTEGTAFWASQETSVAPAWLAATSAIFAQDGDDAG